MKVEVFGDSIRAGYKLKGESYIERIFKDKLVNYSFNGATIFDMANIIYNHLEREKALAIIGCGINDLIMGKSLETLIDRTLISIKKLKELDRIVLVEGILHIKKDYFLALHDFSEEEMNEKIQKFNRKMKEMSLGKDFLFIDYNNLEISTFDGLHPDENGHTAMFGPLKKFVKKHVDLKSL